jgi:hypothetical protein
MRGHSAIISFCLIIILAVSTNETFYTTSARSTRLNLGAQKGVLPEMTIEKRAGYYFKFLCSGSNDLFGESA